MTSSLNNEGLLTWGVPDDLGTLRPASETDYRTIEREIRRQRAAWAAYLRSARREVKLLLEDAAGNPLYSGSMVDIAIDPTNRDTLYMITSTGQVWKTTSAGRDPDGAMGPLTAWTNISFNLPTQAAYKIITDPRNNNLYLGTDHGVYLLPFGTTTWSQFGVGLANTQARLERLYGASQRLELSNGPRGGLHVAITLPFQEMADLAERTTQGSER